ncbi:MAG: hypothetical protein GY810_07425 [Aureispira sp.]|nr:hypothetical protein [Aureispira sp.]
MLNTKGNFLNLILFYFILGSWLLSCQAFGEEEEQRIIYPEQMMEDPFKKKTLADYNTSDVLTQGEKQNKEHSNTLGRRTYGKIGIDKLLACQNCILQDDYAFFLFLLKDGEYSIEYGTIDNIVATIIAPSENTNIMIYSRGEYAKGKSAEGKEIITLSSFFLPSFAAYYRQEMIGYSGAFYADKTEGTILIKDWKTLEEEAAVYEVLRLEKNGKYWIEANSKTKYIERGLDF